MSVLHDSPRLGENEHAFAIRDKYPMAPGHMLICTKREVASWFDTTPEEREAVMQLVALMGRRLEPGQTGHVVMINEGAAQHIPHVHVHLIPYYRERPGGPLGYP